MEQIVVHRWVAERVYQFVRMILYFLKWLNFKSLILLRVSFCDQELGNSKSIFKIQV